MIRFAAAALLVVSAAALSGCAGARVSPSPESLRPPEVTRDPETNALVEVTPTPAAAAPKPTAPIGPMPDWLGYGMATDFLAREGGVAFSAFGRSVSLEEYRTGYRRFLAGRAPTRELEDAYRETLRQRLMVLAWVGRSPMREDAQVRADVREAAREALARAVVERKLAQLPPIPEGQLREEFQRRIDEFQRPAMAQVRLIQVATADEALAVLKRLSEGEPFEALAREVSLHESAPNGGNVPLFPRGTYGIAALEDLAFRLDEGAVDYVRTDAGAFIVEKVATIPEVLRTFDDVREELRVELLERARDISRRALLDQMARELGVPSPSPTPTPAP